MNMRQRMSMIWKRSKAFLKPIWVLNPISVIHNPKTNFQSYFLTFLDGARLEIMTKPNLTDNNLSISQFGFSHLAFSLGSREAVDELTEKLVSAGYDLISGPRITGDGYYESALVVVEGLQIELTL